MGLLSALQVRICSSKRLDLDHDVCPANLTELPTWGEMRHFATTLEPAHRDIRMLYLERTWLQPARHVYPGSPRSV